MPNHFIISVTDVSQPAQSNGKRHDNRLVDVFKIIDPIDREFPVDIIVYTPKELERQLNLADFFVRNILEKGKILYEAKNLKNSPRHGLKKRITILMRPKDLMFMVIGPM